MQFNIFRTIRRFWRGYVRSLWQKLPSLTRIFIIVGAVIAFALLASIPTYSMLRKWRVERNFDAAMAAAKANDDLNARDLAMAVVLAGDRRIDALRILERTMNNLGDPRHFQIANTLLRHPKCSAEDRLQVFHNIVHIMPYGQVMGVWMALPENERHQVPFVVALADRMIDRDGYNDAIGFLEGMREARSNRQVSLRMIRALISRNSKESCQMAQDQLAALWKEAPEVTLDWLDLAELIPAAHLDGWALGPMVSKLSAGMADDPGRAELLAERIRWAGGNPTERQSIIEAAIKHWRGEAPAALARFLFALGKPELILTHFSDDDAATDLEVLRIRLKSQILLSRDGELAATLELQGHLLPPFEYMVYQTVAAHRLGDDASKSMFWQKALDEGAGSQRVDALLEVHRMAIEHGMIPEAEQALVAAIATGRGPLPPFSYLTGVLESLVKRKKENEVLQILQNYIVFEPGNPAVITRYSYLAALRNVETPANLMAKMLTMAETYPDETHVVATLANNCLLAGSLEEASAAWSRLPIKPDDLSPGYRASFIATEFLSGRMTIENPEIVEFPWDALLPSERIQFKKILKVEESADQ